jgi:two-component system chemotaxis response regulator CheB
VTPPAAAAPRAPSDRVKPGDANPLLRLLIVDDSAVARAVLSRMIAAEGEFEIAALAATADEALEVLKSHRVDIILLDLEMPGTNGLDALPLILEAGDGARVLIVSSNCEDGAEAAVKALALGAADTLPKPGSGNFMGSFSKVLCERLLRIGRATKREGARAEEMAARAQLRAMPGQVPECIGIGASTGGLLALNEFFGALPGSVQVPILITQHLPPVFMPFFARQIASAAGRPATVAEHGQQLRPGHILVAPGDSHLRLRRHGAHVVVDLSAVPSGSAGSVDAMISALAECYGADAFAIILSGMGRDGLSGCTSLINQGGAAFVQDEHSSAVWGMPGAVARAGLASAILTPGRIADCVAASIVGKPWK